MLYEGGDCLVKNRVPWSKRVCVRHVGEETLRVLCDGDGCACFVRVPIRKGKEGGAESHVWRGCMYVLHELRYVADALGVLFDEVLSMNR